MSTFPSHKDYGGNNITLENYVGEISQLLIDQLQKEFGTGTTDLAYAATVSKLLAESSAALANAINDYAAMTPLQRSYNHAR
tara:strand:- start:2815 stop:3060 length:246 start_codon:yes stop_codon:yes gene_type:complete